ncbi:hypothetical protein QYE76_033086 [Lolium multiflorum]|uniref:Gag-pol polyprotein n=1 Tax=Lolium multiflorum TaxID=4521 RepID=A0AAD8QUT8_LOLMU|nr:hypothetical protein QYE76_033086 [Lolium multiflorum]
MSRVRPHRDPSSEEILSAEEMVARAVLNTPITPGDAADLEALEATRKEMLATAKKLADTEAALREERAEAAGLAENFDRQDREIAATLEQVKSMRAEWEVKMIYAQAEADRIVREAIPPRRIPFNTPAEHQPLETPKDNMQKAAELLKKKDEEVDINYLRTLVASAMQQQSKADTSRRLESNPDNCVSTAQKDARADRRPDDESHTGSSERRRKAREHPNPIPVPSKTPPSDPRKGKDAMYSGRDKYRNPLLRPTVTRDPLAAVVQPETPGPQGMVGLLSATTCCQETETGSARRNLAGTRTMFMSPSPEGVGMRTAVQNLAGTAIQNLVGAMTQSLAGAVTRTASERPGQPTPGRRQHRSRSQHQEGRGESKAEARNRTTHLAERFEKHFRGTYKRPATTSDLQACIQKKGETSRNFLTRWLACRNECENVDNRTAMHAFIGGLQRGGLLRHKLTCMVNANQLTLDDMITIASDHTAADDDAGGDLAATAIPLHQQKKNRDNGSSSSHKRKNPDDQKSGGSEMIAMAFQRGGSGGGRGRGRGGGAGRGQQHTSEVTAGGSRAPQTYEEYRDMPCLAHLDPATGKSTHTNRNCKWVNDLKNDPEAGYKRARKHRPRGKGGKGKNKDKEDDSSEAMDEDDNSPDPKAGSAGKSNPFDKKSVGAYHTFLGTPTVRATKEDHPAVVPKECYALVVSPRIDGYDFSKCLMDGGASLNIMYLETLERMNLTKEQLKHSNTEFHGVVPGKKANSLGSITLPVAFGDVHNFRQEKITFEVVPFKSSYHVIFGRPTYHKFHARACYIYNKLKIPGPKGATYQRTMQRCLKDQIGRNVHAYVDDIAVMTRKGSDLISDLRNLRQPPQELSRALKNHCDEQLELTSWKLFCGVYELPLTDQQGLPFFPGIRIRSRVPSDIIHDSPRVSAYNEETDEARQLSVDLIEEARNLADQRSAIYQQKLRRYHSRRVRNRSFMAGDLVLRLRQVKDHKLQSPWEGPFIVSKVLHNGSYYLVDFRELRDRPANWHRKRKREDPDDIYDETDRPWNIAQLRPFYT